MPQPGPRTTARYSSEFKATAVRLSQPPRTRAGRRCVALHPSLHAVSLAQTGARGFDHDQDMAMDQAVAAELVQGRRLRRRLTPALTINRGPHGFFSTSSRVSRKYRFAVWSALRCSVWSCHQPQRSRTHYSFVARRSCKSSHWCNAHVRRGAIALLICGCGASQVVHCYRAHSFRLRFLSVFAACGNSWLSWPLFAWSAGRQVHFFRQHARLSRLARGFDRSRLCWVRVAMSAVQRRPTTG